MSGNARMHNNRCPAHYPRMNWSSKVGSVLLLLCITIRTVGFYETKTFLPQAGQFEIQGGMVLQRRTRQGAKEIDRQGQRILVPSRTSNTRRPNNSPEAKNRKHLYIEC